jgi:pyruvate dehydrogenase E1 component alpha subunit
MTTATRSDQAAGKHAEEQLRQMLRVRRFEERCAELYSAGKIRGFLHLYVGEEAVAVGSIPLLRPEDALVSTYREHGHALVRGVPMRAVMAEMYGVVEGCSGGRGGSMHLFDAERRFFGGSAIVGGGLPLAVGLALADRMRGLDHVTACFFGDGATAEGVFHESANLASLWHLPVVFLCENNQYAMGTRLDRYAAQTDLALRGASYEMPAWRVDGMDVDAVASATEHASEIVRGGGGPVFLELVTYRFRAHSMYDADRYRDKAELEAWRARDPIPAHVARATAAGRLAQDDVDALEREVIDEVDDAVAFAEAGHAEPVETLTRWVTSESGRRGADPDGGVS